jgi:hypothetical protein
MYTRGHACRFTMEYVYIFNFNKSSSIGCAPSTKEIYLEVLKFLHVHLHNICTFVNFRGKNNILYDLCKKEQIYLIKNLIFST